MSKDWIVGLQQDKPFEFATLEIFEEESDALAYAKTYAIHRPGHQSHKRTWVIYQGDQKIKLVVRPRERSHP